MSGRTIGEWMTFVGALGGIAGGIVMFVASGKKDRAEMRDGFDIALSGQPMTDGLEQAVAMSHLGLGMLITGIVLVVAGLVVVALRS